MCAMHVTMKGRLDSPLVTRAQKRSKALIESIHRLVWADGFQDKLLSIYHGPLANGLGSAVLKEMSPEVLADIERQSCELVQELSGWTHRNQLLSSEEREALPSIIGCKANLETAQIMQKLFVEDIEFISTHGNPTEDDARYLSPAERRVRVCLTAVHERFQALVTSACDACDDVEARWHTEMAAATSTTNPAPAPAATNHHGLPSDIPVESKRARAKQSFKSIVGFMTIGGKERASMKEEHQPEAENSMGSQVVNVISKPYNPRRWYAPGSRPCLSALPPAPLDELRRRQAKLREDRRLSPHHRATEHSCDVIYQTYREKQSGTAGEANDGNEANLPASETEVSSAPGRSSYGAGRGEDASYTKTEAEILELLGGTSLRLPEGEEDPEARKSWWRERALRDLEGDR